MTTAEWRQGKTGFTPKCRECIYYQHDEIIKKTFGGMEDGVCKRINNESWIQGIPAHGGAHACFRGEYRYACADGEIEGQMSIADVLGEEKEA